MTVHMTPVDSDTPASVRGGRLGDETRFAEFDPLDGEVCVDVVTAVADALDRDPVALEPLSVAVDPEALDALVGRTRVATAAVTSVSFEYLGYEVTVSSDGWIVLVPTADPEI